MAGQPQEIRSFIAIELPDEVKQFIKDLSNQCKKMGGDVRWVRPSAMHLTLKFLGNVDPGLLDSIKDALTPVFTECSPFSLQISGVGAFPNLMKPRVVWVGLDDPTDTLVPLVKNVEQCLEPLGFKREKRGFSPHITLGRVKSMKGKSSLIDGIRQLCDTQGPSFIASGATLFKSILKPTGAEYSQLKRFEFTSS
jgi:2'-5' RNA ligase